MTVTRECTECGDDATHGYRVARSNAIWRWACDACIDYFRDQKRYVTQRLDYMGD